MNIHYQLQQIRTGRREAFTPIVEHYQQALFGYLGRMGLSQEHAEDLAQETFLKAWQNLARYDPDRAAFSTWLFTIAHRLALNFLQAAHHKEQTQEADNPIFATTNTPQTRTEQQATHHRLQKALRRLPLQERSALALAHLQGIDLKTLARMEGCSEAALKVRLHRARQKLHQWLDTDHG